ncbi:MAG TPA: MarR family transcriptional regulator [Micromonosporaceae bacterium]|nr:MarR family transcriptional regulator [Micromonosporaceae bacterium]
MATNGAGQRASTEAPLVEALLAIGRVMLALTARSIARLDVDVTLSQCRVLVLLAAHGPRRTTDLAAHLGVSPSTVTRTCDRLVNRGLARRFRRDDDRRASWITLTEDGKGLIGSVMRQRREDVDRLAREARLHSPAVVARALDAVVAAAGELPEAEWWRRWELSAAMDSSG